MQGRVSGILFCVNLLFIINNPFNARLALCRRDWGVNPSVRGRTKFAPTGVAYHHWSVQIFAGGHGDPPLRGLRFGGDLVRGFWWAVDSCTCTFRKKRIVPLLGTMRFSYTYEMPRVYFFTVVFLLAVFFAAGCFADVASAFFALGAAGFALSAGNADLVCQMSRA